MIKNSPLRSLGIWAIITAVFFVLSASGNSSWFSGPAWLGSVGWAGFLIGLLGLIAFGIYLSVARLRRAR
jgi:hypothetical protein